jgi:hypothetical protein
MAHVQFETVGRASGCAVRANRASTQDDGARSGIELHMVAQMTQSSRST